MRFTLALLLIAATLGLGGCSEPRNSREFAAKTSQEASQITERAKLQTAGNKTDALLEQQNVPLTQADAANNASQASERKIIRNANLTVEVTSPTDTQRKVVSIAESHQGFVVTSESTQRTTEDKSKPEITVNLTVRVPATQFNQVMEEIRALGIRVSQEKVTGQDVTEEFIDLEARIKNQKALEGQFIEIMKRAGKVEDALQVQRELAAVRTEIEKLEGRRRFLENQASLSTINITLQTPTEIVINAAGFWFNLKSAFGDGFDVAVAIIFFLIRAITALLPIVVLVLLPLALIVKFVVRRLWRWRARQLKDSRSETVE
ncbi:MAG: hypothetical protein QOD75_735 [Blastocatellia bacterium]|jgi:hypothetical protein|nr:hypothetical protein [Blastocatellia bacterium]